MVVEFEGPRRILRADIFPKAEADRDSIVGL